MDDKFVTNVQVEENKEYQDWLDAQELKDIENLESQMNNLINGEPV